MDRKEQIKNIMNLDYKIKRLNVFSLLGLAPPFEMGILTCLKNSEDSRVCVSGIARSLNATSPNVSRVLKSLEKEGKVYREVDENDRRNTFVYLTDKGKECLKQTGRTVGEFMFGVLDCLGDEELLGYSEIMKKLYSSYVSETEKIKKAKSKAND